MNAAAALFILAIVQAGDVAFSNPAGSPIFSIDFGNVGQDTSASRNIVLRNTSGYIIEDFFVSLGGPLSKAGNLSADLVVTCPLDLLPNDTCPVTVIVNPTRQRKFKGSLDVTGSYFHATHNVVQDVSESRPITGEGLPRK